MLRTFVAPVVAGGLMACAAAGSAQTNPRASLPDLAWIGGCWAADPGEVGSGEQWMPLAGGNLLGTSRTVKGGKTVAFEFMQIRENADGVPEFVAWPSGRNETHFPLARHVDGAAVFENLGHDFPQRVIYRRVDATRLHARIEGRRGDAVRGIDFPMTRVTCDAQAVAK